MALKAAPPSMKGKNAGEHRVGPVHVLVLRRGHRVIRRLSRGRKTRVASFIIVQCQADCLRLFVHCALPSGLARRLNGRQEQRDENGYDGDDDQQLDQCETSFPTTISTHRILLERFLSSANRRVSELFASLLLSPVDSSDLEESLRGSIVLIRRDDADGHSCSGKPDEMRRVDAELRVRSIAA